MALNAQQVLALFSSGFYAHPEIQQELESIPALENLTKRVESSFFQSVLDDQVHQTAPKATSSRNRYGRPYISGRPLLTCDRKKIVELYDSGMKKINIAKKLGITHSCVSKVLRRYHETGVLEARICRTASCSCPGSSSVHDARYCKHLRNEIVLRRFTIENILLEDPGRVRYY